MTLRRADATATTIQLANATTMQVHRAAVTTDTEGTRQATVLVPPGTQATLTLPDGGTSALTAMTVRATEYTVGDAGPSSMPAELPPTSAYTYAVELSADEAANVGASVAFTQPAGDGGAPTAASLPFYVENFLGFPAGTSVPAGSYEAAKGAWVPSSNGVVIQILSVSGGLATLDVTGSGAAATAADLAALGVTNQELQTIAGLYGAGQSVWRVPVGHFSRWDFNWGFGPPANAAPPAPPGAPQDGSGAGPGACQQTGSIIDCQDQTLRERLPIAGTPFSLSYSSNRQLGRGAGLQIPLSGATFPGPVRSLELEIDVAGRVFPQSFANPLPNQTFSFAWDGKDVFGRLVQGLQPVTVRIGHTYDGVYQQTAKFGYAGNGTPITGSKTRKQVTLWTVSSGAMGVWDSKAEGLGGWSLDVHHNLDVSTGVVHFGDGTDRTPRVLRGVIQTVAGNGLAASGQQSRGDEGPAVAASVTDPTAVVPGPDGSLYIAEGNCVRRVTPDGIIHTFAGQCAASGPAVEGAQATATPMRPPNDLALGPDGSLYILSNCVVLRVDPTGIVHTVAGHEGTSGCTFGGDRGPATQASFNFARSIDVASDGTIYIADTQNNRIRRVSTDGIIDTVAGTGGSGGAGSGGPATTAVLASPTCVSVARDGSFYVGEAGAHWVRRVGTDGMIRLFAGTGGTSTTGGDGALATATTFVSPERVAIAPDGTVVIVDDSTRYRRVMPDGTVRTVAGGRVGFSGDGGPATAAGFSAARASARFAPDGTLYISNAPDHRVRAVGLGATALGPSVVASDDGRQQYVFDASGRHQQTVDALTGKVLYAFAYTNGQLASITQSIDDAHSDVTTIHRDPSGRVLDITGPFGGKTTLGLDPNGYLQSLEDPAGQTTQLTYSSDGLMATRTDARFSGAPAPPQHVFSYANGRLHVDQDPAGGSKTLAQTFVPNGFNVNLTTTSGVSTTYQTSTDALGNWNRVNTLPSALQTTLTFASDYTTTTTAPDGTTTTETETPDPRFGMMSPVRSLTTKTPLHTRTEVRTRAVTPAVGPVATFTEQLTVNGLGSGWKRAFDASTLTWTTTSPVGRTSTVTVDPFERPLQIAVPGVTPVAMTYDAHGRLQTVTQGTFLQGGLPAPRQWTMSYDANGFLSSVTDPLAHAVTYQNDAVGRPHDTLVPDGLNGTRDVQTAFDGNDNLTSVTLPRSSAGVEKHELNYTPVDLLSSYAPPSLGAGTGSTSDAYDVDNRLMRETRPDASAIVPDYDAAGRLFHVTYPQGVITRHYDPTHGQLQSIAMPGGETVAFGYDGALLTGTTWSGPVAGAVGLGYDNAFRMTSQTVNGGSSQSFGYDNDDLLTSAGAMTLTRDPVSGRLTGSTLGSFGDTVAYDGNGLFGRYTGSFGGTTVYAENIVSRDGDERITERTETVAGVAHDWVYAYDAGGRLTDVTKDGAAVSHYGYDADDNRITGTTSGVTVNATYDVQDRLSAYGAKTFTYGPNGELQTKTEGGQITSTTYDVFGNLLHVTLPSGTTIDYVVDGMNRRVGKRVNGTLTTGFLYQDALKPIAQLDGTGKVVARFVYGTKANVPDYMTTAAGTFRILSDHLGSPRVVVDTASGSVVEQIDYDEFGNVVGDTSPGLTPFGFAGGLYDKDTGLVRFGARDYDASVGRWTSKDPIRFGGGQTNLYDYVGSDPVNHSDADGQGPWTALGVEAACQTYALSQFYISSQQLAALADQIAALRDQIGKAHEQMMCNEEPAVDPSAFQQEINQLLADYANQQAASSAGFAAEEVICAALGAAALAAPTP